ncbi:MAG: metalloregulator ArsR/SmtB family transcription factor [Bacteroidota bacterium]
MLLSEQLDYSLIERTAKRISIMAHPMRATIIELLLINKRMSVTDIFMKLHILQAEASHHLTLLKDFGIVKRVREGKKSMYYVDMPYFERLMEHVEILSARRK